MTFEDILAATFNPGAAEVFAFGVGVAFACFFYAVLGMSLFLLIFSLIRRYIWPGKKTDVTQTQDLGSGAAD